MDLVFIRKLQNAGGIWSFYFEKPEALRYNAGDYIELTLPQCGPMGDKRWFTLASSPTESELMITTKIDDKPSDYKQTLLQCVPGDSGICSPPIGSFNLPHDPKAKLLFIAGGIGITPYRSMLRYVQDTKDPRDIELVYVAKPTDFIFGDVIEAAHIPVHQVSEKIDLNWIKKRVATMDERILYFSGPQNFCETLYEQAQAAGWPLSSLKLCHFEGHTDI